MSYELVRRALRVKVGMNSAKLVLWALADHVNEKKQDDLCFPSLATLAAETELSLAQIPRAIQHLEQLGLVEVIRGGGRRVNTYRMVIPQPSTDEIAAPSPVATNQEYNQEEIILSGKDSEEEETLKVLRSIKGYRYEYKKDLEFVRVLIADFPHTDILEVSKKVAANFIDHPLKPKDRPRVTLRNWCESAEKRGYSRKTIPGEVDPYGRQVPPLVEVPPGNWNW